MRIRTRSLTTLGLLLVFKALLEIVYVLFVSRVYAYAGFVIQLSAPKLVESYIFVVFIYFFLPLGERRISAVGTKLLLISMVVPTLSLYALKNESREFCYLFVGGFLSTLLTIRLLAVVQISKIKKSAALLFLGLAGISALVYGVLLKRNGLPSLRALNLGSAVYEIRRISDWGPGIMGYLVKWQGKVINCFLIGLTWYKRRYFSLLAVLGLQLLLFLITAHKSFLLAPLFVIALMYAMQKKRPFRLILWGGILGIVFSFALYAFGLSNMPASLFIRRTFFVPAQISFQYYDYFSKNELTYLSQSHLRILLSTKNPYEDWDSIANMMGAIYANNPNTHMNTGYLAESYMNFGLPGVFIFSVILGMFFLIADSVARKSHLSIAMAAMAMPIIGLVNGALFTNFLTGGFGLGLFILYLYTKHEARVIGKD